MITLSWTYITPEQGAVIDAICEQFRTPLSYRENDCPDCPIRQTCRMELPKGTNEAAAAERTRIFEEALAEAADCVANRCTQKGR